MCRRRGTFAVRCRAALVVVSVALLTQACASSEPAPADAPADKPAACAAAFDNLARIGFERIREDHADDPTGFERDAALKEAEALRVEMEPGWRSRCERWFPDAHVACLTRAKIPYEANKCDADHHDALIAARPKADEALCERVAERQYTLTMAWLEEAVEQGPRHDEIRAELAENRASMRESCRHLPQDLAECLVAAEDLDTWRACLDAFTNE